MKTCCGLTPRKLPWTQFAPADYWGVQFNAMRRSSHGAMISFVVAIGKMACTKLELSNVYECPNCKRRWRTWFDGKG